MFLINKGYIYVILICLVLTACSVQPEDHPETGDVACKTCHGNSGRMSPPEADSLPAIVNEQLAEENRGLTKTIWTLVSFGQPGAAKPVTEEGHAITLAFYDGEQAGGSGSCNPYNALYVIQGDHLSFDDITHSLKTCKKENVVQQEGGFFAALESAGRFEITGDWMTIEYNDGHDVLNWVLLYEPQS